MKKLLLILLTIAMFSSNVKGNFEGLPWETNTYWEQGRSLHIVKQLFEGIQERCEVLDNHNDYSLNYGDPNNHNIMPLLIEEDWTVQDGYSIETYTKYFGTNLVTITNRLPHYFNFSTTNQVDDLIINYTDSTTNSNWEPLITNRLDNLLNVSLPLTYELITAMDSKMFQMTPFFVQTNKYVNGSFDQYFFGLPETYTNYPMHNSASVCKNAGIGYVTNIVYDSTGTIIGGIGWLTRQPNLLNQWALWQAVAVDGIVASGFSNNRLNGNYMVYNRGEPELEGWWISNQHNMVIDPDEDSIYLKEDYSAIITKKSIYSSYNLYYGLPTVYIWSIDEFNMGSNGTFATRLDIGWTDNSIATSPKVGNVNTNGNIVTNTTYGYMTITYEPYSSSLLATNNWRTIYPWKDAYYDNYFFIRDYNDTDVGQYEFIDTFNNHPQISGRIDYTNFAGWKCKPLSTYDVRYYDEGPRPFFNLKINTNGIYSIYSNLVYSLDVSVKGASFINFNDPDLFGQQVARDTNEKFTLTTTNHISSNRWFNVDNVSNTYVKGWAPLGSSITLMWTNSHTFSNLPYALEIKDLGERAKYLKELVWTVSGKSKWNEVEELEYTGYQEPINIHTQIVETSLLPNGYNDWGDDTSGGSAWLVYWYNFAYTRLGYWDSGVWTGYKDPSIPLPYLTNYPDLQYIFVTPSGMHEEKFPYVHLEFTTYMDRHNYAYWRYPGYRLQNDFLPYFFIGQNGDSWGYVTDFNHYPYNWYYAAWNLDGPWWTYDMTDRYQGRFGGGDYFPHRPTYDCLQWNNVWGLGNGCQNRTYTESTNTMHDMEFYCGVTDFSSPFYTGLKKIDTLTNIWHSGTSLVYRISVSNTHDVLVNTNGNYFTFQSIDDREYLEGDVINTYVTNNPIIWSNEVYTLLSTNEVVITTNDCVFSWYHYNPPITIFESNTYHNVNSKFYWNGYNNVVNEYSTNYFDVIYTNKTLTWNYDLWWLLPDWHYNYSHGTIFPNTFYFYELKTNIVSCIVTSEETVVYNGINEYNAIAYLYTNGAYLHTTNDDYSYYNGSYWGTNAINRCNFLNITNEIFIKTNLYEQTVTSTNTYALIVKTEEVEKEIFGYRDYHAEIGTQGQNDYQETNIVSRTLPPLIKWHFKRK